MPQINWSDVINPVDQAGERGAQPIVLNRYQRKPSGKLAAVPAVDRKLPYKRVEINHRQVDARRHNDARHGILFGRKSRQQLTVDDAVWIGPNSGTRVVDESLTLADKWFQFHGLEPVGTVELSDSRELSPLAVFRLARFAVLSPDAIALTVTEGKGDKSSYRAHAFYLEWRERLKFLGLVGGQLHCGRPIQYLESKSQRQLADVIDRFRLDPETGDFLERLSRNTSVTTNTINPELFGNLVDALDIDFLTSDTRRAELPTVYRGVLPSGYLRYIDSERCRESVSYRPTTEAVELSDLGFEPADNDRITGERDACVKCLPVLNRVNRALGYYRHLGETRFKFKTSSRASANGNLTFGVTFTDRMEGDPEFNRLLGGSECFAFTVDELRGQPVTEGNSLANIATFDEPDIEFEPDRIRLPEPYHSQVKAGQNISVGFVGSLPLVTRVNLVGNHSTVYSSGGCDVLSLGPDVAYLESGDGFPVTTGVVDSGTQYVEGCHSATESVQEFYRAVNELADRVASNKNPQTAVARLDRYKSQYGKYLSVVKRAYASHLTSVVGESLPLVSEFLENPSEASFVRLTGSEAAPDWIANRDLLALYLSLVYYNLNDTLSALQKVWPEFRVPSEPSRPNALLDAVFGHTRDTVEEIAEELDPSDPELREFVVNSIEGMSQTLVLLDRHLNDATLSIDEREACAVQIRGWLPVSK